MKKAVIVGLLLVMALTGLGLGREIVVTSTADSGTGSFRWALQTARSGDTITFDPEIFPPDDPATIYPKSRLPVVHQGQLTIDASDAGIILDGSCMEEDWVIGLEIRSDGNAIRGLQIVKFLTGAGIALSKHAENNVIGGSRSVGSGPLGQGNLCSGNGVGIRLQGARVSHNAILGNFIGTDTSGTEPWGNQTGIYVLKGASHNTIGPDNIIAFNKEEGVQIYNPGSLFNTISRNSIHDNGVFGILLNEDGNGDLPAPSVTSADFQTGTLVGSACANCIVEIFSDRGSEGGVYEGQAVADASGAFAFEKGGPFFGPNVTLTTTATDGSTSGFAVAVLSVGVASLSQEGPPQELIVASTVDSGYGTLRWALQAARAGDTVTFDPAVFPPENPATIRPRTALPPIRCGRLTIIASNAGVILDGSKMEGDWVVGLEIYSDGNTIQGLQIINCFPGAGIVLQNAQRNTIGGSRNIGFGPMGQGNLMSGNAIGIVMSGTGTMLNKVAGNLIGTDVAGERAWPGREGWGNYDMGVYITRGASHNVIGPDNVIAYNGGAGVQVYRANSVCNTITRNSIHNNGVEQICLNAGGNGELSPPVILSFSLADGSVSGVGCRGCTIEVLSQGNGVGMLFEGEATVDETGSFTFTKGSPFVGSHLIATVTDESGNTSEFSRPTSGLRKSAILQDGNNFPRTQLMTKRSGELGENWIGDFPEIGSIALRLENLLRAGFKWQKVDILQDRQHQEDKDSRYGGTFWEVDWHTEDYTVDPEDDNAITELANNGVSLVACLGCLLDETGLVEHGRFKTEEEIQLYLSYVRTVVRHFKGRIQYYDIWNEPNAQCLNWYVEVLDYINLVRRTIPVILEEYPEAKIMIGSTTSPDNPTSLDYLLRVLSSDILPLVDIVSWHPMFGTSPEYAYCKDYYYEYPSIVQKIKDVASAHGFEGEYYAAEINWRTPVYNNPGYWQPTYSETVCAKYYARGILMHLGMDVMAGIITWGDNPTAEDVVRNLCTVMAGHEAIDMPVAIDIDYEPVAYCAFRYPNGDRILAVWTDGVAQDNDPGVPATITFPGLVAESVVGIDVLHGFEQELVLEIVDESTVVHDLLVKDYPIILRLAH